MSADDWYICPHCRGKKHPDFNTNEQIRADYQLWISDNGFWEIRGAARCDICSRAWIANITIEPCKETTGSETWKMCQDENRRTRISCFGKVKSSDNISLNGIKGGLK